MQSRFVGKLIGKVLSIILPASQTVDPITVTVGTEDVFAVDPDGNLTCGTVNGTDISTITPAEVTQQEFDALASTVAGKANSTHSHAQSEITDLPQTLAGKASSIHGHGQSDVTGLTDALADKADASDLETLAGKQWQTLTWWVNDDMVTSFPKYFAGDGSGATGYQFPINVHIRRMTITAECREVYDGFARFRGYAMRTGSPVGGYCNVDTSSVGFARQILTYSGEGLAFTPTDEFSIIASNIEGFWQHVQVIVDYTID